MGICSGCDQEVEVYAHGKRCLTCYRERKAEAHLVRYHKRRAIAVDQLGGKCVECSATDQLEFDHIDPDTKTINVYGLFATNETRLQEELAKCQLLCRSCHERKTSAQFSVPHGGGLSGKKNCPCDLCKSRKAEYMKTYMLTHHRKRDRA